MAGPVILTEDDAGWDAPSTAQPIQPTKAPGRLVLLEDDGGWEAAPTTNAAPGPWRAGFVSRETTDPLPHPPPPAAPAATSRGEAFARGVVSGATYGNSAQAAGGLAVSSMDPALMADTGAAPDPRLLEGWGQRYENVRDAYAARDAQARSEHKAEFVTGELAASFATPGPKGVVKNAAVETVSTAARTGDLEQAAAAGAGALAAGTVAKGVLKGGGYALRKVVGEAPARVEARATNALLEGTPARTVQDPAIAKLGGKAEIPRVLKAEGLEKHLHGPANKLEEELDARLDEVGRKLGGIYERVAKADPGVPPEYLRDRLMRLADKHRADPESAQAIRNYANSLRAEYNEVGAMSAQDLHEVTQALGRRGYGSNPANPSMGAQLKREIRNEVRDVLQQHVDDVAKRKPDVGSLAELKELNRRYSRLTGIDDIATAKAERNERYSPTLGQRAQQVARYATSAVGAAGAAQQLSEGNFGVAAAGALATGAALAAPHLVRAADRLAAGVADSRAANALRSATTLQELVRRAALVGIPREAALEAARAALDEEDATQALPASGPAPLVSGR